MGAATGRPSATTTTPSNPIDPYPMLLSVSRSTDKFIGLRSLLFSDAAEVGGGGVVMRPTIVASRARGACGDDAVEEPGDGESIDRHKKEENEDDGCWVSYGRREPRRRMPPPVPSLAARSTLRRTRTEDRRLVITKVPIMRPDYYVRSRRRGGRLTMRLVEREDDSDPLPPAPDQPPEPSAREDGIAQAENNATALDACDVHTAKVAPSSLPAVGCFENVFKCQYAIGSSPLRQMPMLTTMVH